MEGKPAKVGRGEAKGQKRSFKMGLKAEKAMVSMMENLKNFNMEARSTNEDQDNFGPNQMFELELQISDIEGGQTQPDTNAI